MEELFKQIKSFKENDIDLFYNSDGNEHAFKLFVRHLSFAPKLGYGKITNDSLILKKDIYIVDFEEGLIDLFAKNTEIKVVTLKILENE